MNIEREFKDLQNVIEEAGKEARAYFDSAINPNTQKEDGSVVTDIDKQTEATLRAHIAERFPNDTIVGEEDDTVEGDSGFVWFIDPIDGTDNFVRKIPFFAVTATRLGPTAEDSFAVVHNPISGQTFASLMENGSYENNNLCTVTANTIGGRQAINVSGNSRKAGWVKRARNNLRTALDQKYGKSGTLNSALLELAYVAADRLDGYMSFETSPWDLAAGLYLVRAAGGSISIFNEGTWQRYEDAIQNLFGVDYNEHVTVFVSHQDIHDEILQFVGDPEAWSTE